MIFLTIILLLLRICSTKELKQLVRLFRLLSNPRISKLGIQLMKCFGHIQFPVDYNIFNAGCFVRFMPGQPYKHVNLRLLRFPTTGCHSYLNYAIEDSSTESEFDTNCEMVQKLITHAAKTNDIPFSVCKPTSFGHKHLFQKINAKQSLNTEEQIAWKRVINRFRSLLPNCAGTWGWFASRCRRIQYANRNRSTGVRFDAGVQHSTKLWCTIRYSYI